MTTRRSRLLTAGAAAVAALFTITGCAASDLPAGTPPTTIASVPMPPGASFGAQIPENVDAQSCDAITSLRPMSPMPEPEAMPADSTMARIAARGRLIVGTDTGSHPLSFRDPISGDIRGFDIDVASWISEAIFGSVRIEYRILGTDERIRALQNGDVDIIAKSMTITCERRQSVEFSAPYYVASQRVLVYRNSGIESVAGLAGKSVCATRNSTPITRIQRQVPDVKLVTTNTWADCLVMMQQGQVDAIVSDEPLLSGIVSQDPWVRIVGEPIGIEYYGIGIPMGEDDLVRFVNGVLQERRADGSWQQAYNTWLAQLGPAIPPPTSYRD